MTTQYEDLDYAATLARLTDLRGRELLLELRVGSVEGPFRLAARGVLTGQPDGQVGLSERRAAGDDMEAFLLSSGGFFTVEEKRFLRSQWHAGREAGQFSAQPRLNIVFSDSVLHIAVLETPR